MSNSGTHSSTEDIAIIGMSGRFPGARNIGKFWQNLRDGVESISFFSDQELGIDPAVLGDPNYVKARGVLDDIESFDASFFGFNPREADIMDPQQRLFLECAWEALENAGYDPEKYDGLIGVYAGANMNTYLLFNLYSNHEFIESVGDLQTIIGNDKDFLATRVSYELNLKGPSMAVQTACSTSLVAVCLACQGLLNYQCDMALAGGVSIGVPQKAGYFYQEGGIASPDGHCRAFDARARGTVSGNGLGIVVLKRLADALADGDCIQAIIKGSAVNNDGSLKVGYTAPSVDGQAEVIAMAQAMAMMEPETITYIEAHGTGTSLGDPIEVAALTQVFRASTKKKGFCAIGSVKTNIGHLGAAAGVAGLIKTVLALKHKLLPPSLHFEQPNSKIDFANSPFYVNSLLSGWKSGRTPRRAGISSFGIGGTNAHVILEEAPMTEASGSSRPWHLLVLSAKTRAALEIATANLIEHLEQHPNLNLADVAYTLQVGRKAFNHRLMLGCRNLDDAVSALKTLDPKRVFTTIQEPGTRPIGFMFPGQGTQYVNMALELYQVELTFREQVDHCAELLKPYLGLDLRSVLYPTEEQSAAATQQLNQTFITQPVLFVIEYALAKLWMQWGVRPQTMIGHSIGEYVAACLAGVFPLEDALSLVALRGRTIQELPGGAMLSVPLPEKEVHALLGKRLSLAAINGPSLCVISGPIDAVDDLQNLLNGQGVNCRRLHVSHAFHSAMMEPILETFAEQVKKVEMKPPKIPFVSNVTGTWITAAEATDPSYWTRHLRQPVRFADGVQELLKEPDQILLELGPGQTLGMLARQHSDKRANPVVLSSLRQPHDQHSDVAFLLNTLGRLWLAGVEVDWSEFYAGQRCHRIPLPSYPFEHRRYWIEPQASLRKKPNIADWFYIPLWKQSMPPIPSESLNQKSCWLVFVDTCGIGSQIVTRLEQAGQDVIIVMIGEQFTRLSDRVFAINPREFAHYDALLEEIRTLDKTPKIIVHLWTVTPDEQAQLETEFFENFQHLGLYSLLFLAQALGKRNITHPIRIDVVSNNVQEVTGEEILCPVKAMVLASCKVTPQEYSNIICRSIDIAIPKSGTAQEKKLIDQLIVELSATPSDLVVAYRGNHRWVQIFEAAKLNGKAGRITRLREGGVYLITGGLGDIGLALAAYLAGTVRAKLVLIGRSAFPVRGEWARWLATHDDQDDVSRKIRKLQALEDLGAEILVFSTDVANQEQMQKAVDQAYERFGAIHGVIHAAGITSGSSFRSIQEIGKSEFEQQFQAKVHGLLALANSLQSRKLDFYLLLSSLSSVLGGIGFIAYSAANLFMDAFAHKHNQTQAATWISVNWDSWRLGKEKVQDTALGGSLAALALTPGEGVETFHRILSVSEVTHIVVSTGDLQSRIDQWIKLKFLREIEYSRKEDSSLLHPRSNLQNAYIAPSDDIERTIAANWQTLLGIEQVGIHDNFFELGGHSLLAIQLISQLRHAFHVDVSLPRLFEMPTIAGLSEIIKKSKDSSTELPRPALVPVSRERYRVEVSLQGVPVILETLKKDL